MPNYTMFILFHFFIYSVNCPALSTVGHVSIIMGFCSLTYPSLTQSFWILTSSSIKQYFNSFQTACFCSGVVARRIQVSCWVSPLCCQDILSNSAFRDFDLSTNSILNFTIFFNIFLNLSSQSIIAHHLTEGTITTCGAG